MKRLLAFLMVLSLVTFSMAFTIAEEEKPKEFASGGFHYVLRDDGSVKLIIWIRMIVLSPK